MSEAQLMTAGLISAEKDKGEGLRALIAAAGGTTAKAPSKFLPDHGVNRLVIGSDAAAEKDRSWCHSKFGSQLSFLTRTAFTDCIMQQSLEASLSK